MSAVLPHYLNFRGDSSIYTHRPTKDIFVVTVDPDLEGILWHINASGSIVAGTYLNTMASGLFQMPFVDNGHYYPALGVDPDGYIHIAANMRSNVMKVAVSNVPLSVTSGFTSEILALGSIVNWGYTYPNYANYADGALIMSLRRRQMSPELLYGHTHMYIKTAGAAWVDLGSYASGTHNVASGAYPTPPAIDPVDDVLRIHGVWAEIAGGIPAENRVNPWYMQSSDRTATWQNAVGTTVTKPQLFSTRTEVMTGQSPGGEFDDPITVSLNQNGSPTFTSRNILGTCSRQTWNGGSLTNWGVSNPAVATGCPNSHSVYRYRQELWYITSSPDANVRPVFVNRFGNKHRIGPYTHGDPFLNPALDQGALKDGILRTFVLDADGFTPLIRDWGHGYKYEIPA